MNQWQSCDLKYLPELTRDHLVCLAAKLAAHGDGVDAEVLGLHPGDDEVDPGDAVLHLHHCQAVAGGGGRLGHLGYKSLSQAGGEGTRRQNLLV